MQITSRIVLILVSVIMLMSCFQFTACSSGGGLADFDFDGDARPYGAGWDIGVDEWTPRRLQNDERP